MIAGGQTYTLPIVSNRQPFTTLVHHRGVSRECVCSPQDRVYDDSYICVDNEGKAHPVCSSYEVKLNNERTTSMVLKGFFPIIGVGYGVAVVLGLGLGVMESVGCPPIFAAIVAGGLVGFGIDNLARLFDEENRRPLSDNLAISLCDFIHE